MVSKFSPLGIVCNYGGHDGLYGSVSAGPLILGEAVWSFFATSYRVRFWILGLAFCVVTVCVMRSGYFFDCLVCEARALGMYYDFLAGGGVRTTRSGTTLDPVLVYHRGATKSLGLPLA